MKKLNLIISHSDIVNVLSEIMELECVEPTEPEITLDPPELTDMLHREVMSLESYNANFESVVLLMSQYTYFLTGWLPAVSEPALSSLLAKYMCAWEIVDLDPHDTDIAPIDLKYPQILGKFRSGGRKVFVPLSKSRSS